MTVTNRLPRGASGQARGHHPVEHVERQRAAVEHRGVELLDVEPRRPGAARPRPASAGSRAARSCRTSPGRACRCSGRPRAGTTPSVSGRVGHHEVDRLLPAPAEGVEAGVDDEPAGPQGVGAVHPHPVDRARSRAPSRRRAARCRGPSPRRTPSCGGACGTRASCRAAREAIASWRWCPGMPSWKAIASSSKRPHDVGVVGVDEERAAAAAVGGRREVERLRADRRCPRRRTAPAARPRTSRAIAASARASATLDCSTISSPCSKWSVGVGPHRLEDLLEVVGADDLGPERAVLVGQLGRPGPARCRGSPGRSSSVVVK